jgi:hypothetical protein
MNPKTKNDDQWYWVWQYGRCASYAQGGTRTSIAEDYVRYQHGDINLPVFIVESEAPTKHVFTMMGAS